MQKYNHWQMRKSDYQNLQNKMKKIHKLLSYLPIFIVINWVICFVFLRNAYFYKKHYYMFDYLDTFLVGISFIHFFFYHRFYKKTSKTCILCIIAIIFLTISYIWIDEIIYQILYLIIISLTAIQIIRND